MSGEIERIQEDYDRARKETTGKIVSLCGELQAANLKLHQTEAALRKAARALKGALCECIWAEYEGTRSLARRQCPRCEALADPLIAEAVKEEKP